MEGENACTSAKKYFFGRLTFLFAAGSALFRHLLPIYYALNICRSTRLEKVYNNDLMHSITKTLKNGKYLSYG